MYYLKQTKKEVKRIKQEGDTRRASPELSKLMGELDVYKTQLKILRELQLCFWNQEMEDPRDEKYMWDSFRAFQDLMKSLKVLSKRDCDGEGDLSEGEDESLYTFKELEFILKRDCDDTVAFSEDERESLYSIKYILECVVC